MRIEVLKEFVVLAQVLHYRQAAARLHLSQPALSRHMQELETELDAQLFERSRHAVTLTSAGQAFLEEVRPLLAGYDRAADLSRRISLGLTATFRVGHIGPGSFKPLATLMARWARSSPPLHLQVMEGTSSSLREDLREGRIDLALLRPPLHDEDLEEAWLVDQLLSVLVPSSHPLAHASSLELTDLREEELIFPAQTVSGAHDEVRRRCISEGVPISLVEASSSTSLMASVVSGTGLAILPASAVESWHSSDVAVVPLAGADLVYPLHAAWRRTDTSPLLTESVDLLRKAAADGRSAPRVAS